MTAPLTLADRLSVQEDLDTERWRLDQDLERPVVPGREQARRAWLEMRRLEIARLERMLGEDA